MRTCKTHGEHENWRYRENKKEYVCRYCVRETRKQKRITANYNAILAAKGKEHADLYMQESKTRSVNVFEFLDKRRSFIDCASLEKQTKNNIERVLLLNLASSFDTRNIGWFCFRCNLYKEDPSFFDIDRIIEGKDGGLYEEGNIQVLCPNCHRCKTLGLDDWTNEIPENIKKPEHRKKKQPITPMLPF